MTQVTFVHYDEETGRIHSSTSEHADHYAARLDRGEAMIRIDHPVDPRRFRVNPQTLRIEPCSPPPSVDDVLGAIRKVLFYSDRYFTGDALDNISQAEQDAWRIYRKALRDAAKQASSEAILAALPPANPKGVDAFQQFRR